MGYLKDRFGLDMIACQPDNTCPECGRDHEPEMPHDNQSLIYQYRFYDQHGRWPTWNDAMAHCDEIVRRKWKAALEGYGIDMDEKIETDLLSFVVNAPDD